MNVLAPDGASVKRHGKTVEYGQPQLIPRNDGLRLLPVPIRPPLRLLRVRDFLSLSLSPRARRSQRELNLPTTGAAL
jgi:hypothetical protein